MDGGQPLKYRKLRTVKERIYNQLASSLRVKPSTQKTTKVFPCMGRQVFATSVKNLGIPVFQSDFDADLDIAGVAKTFNLTVLTNDSDFFIFDVPMVLLQSVDPFKLRSSKQSGKKMINFIPCQRFNREKFCKVRYCGYTVCSFEILLIFILVFYLNKL